MLIQESFTEQAVRTPDAIALITPNNQLSYSELDVRAEMVASVLRQLGVGPDVPVGLYLSRSDDLVVAMLGVLKADGGYIPLNPSSPQRWIESQLEIAAARVVITRRADAGHVPGNVHAVVMEEVSHTVSSGAGARGRSRACPDNLAYIMYTSGSTGQPKAVAVPHRGVVRLVTDQDYAALDQEQVILFHTPSTFDVSGFEIWGALLNGGRLVIPPPGIISVGALGRLIRRYEITTIWITAPVFTMILEEDPEALRPLRQLITGGEAVPPASLQAARRLLPDTSLIVGYGPTESTVFATAYPVASDGPIEGVPIGRAIRGTAAYILDESMRLAPPGTDGELCLAGDGLAWGYLGSPDVTAERFVPDPLSTEPGSRLYRTGDNARWRADGIIEFRGRLDDEIKVRGRRLQPMAIEHVLLTHPDVISAHVMAESNATRGTYLVAYVACRPGAEVEPRTLRSHLAELVPEHMWPDVYIVRPALPLTAHGKLDRRRLLDADSGKPLTAPHDGDGQYQVVRNHSDQYALWPADLQVPVGWALTGTEGSRSHCLAYLRRTWTDIRPAHLRGMRACD
jgi:amino acid adenylation domain-containing protein